VPIPELRYHLIPQFCCSKQLPLPASNAHFE
jgi:hypothetical protein